MNDLIDGTNMKVVDLEDRPSSVRRLLGLGDVDVEINADTSTPCIQLQVGQPRSVYQCGGDLLRLTIGNHTISATSDMQIWSSTSTITTLPL